MATGPLPRRLMVVPAIVLAAGACVVAGCGTSGSTSSTGSTQALVARADAWPLTRTINGEVPPGRPTLVETSTEVLTTSRRGEQVRVFRNVREPGTRSPIHIHIWGGWSCVMSGQAVLYLEGAKPQRTGPGECVNMPPMTPMSNHNPGPGPTELLDTFIEPPGEPVWHIIERGYTDLGNEFAHGDHQTKTNP